MTKSDSSRNNLVETSVGHVYGLTEGFYVDSEGNIHYGNFVAFDEYMDFYGVYKTLDEAQVSILTYCQFLDGNL